MPRDESMDVFVATRNGVTITDDWCVSKTRDGVFIEDGCESTRYVPHAHLVDLERQLAESKAEIDAARESLSFLSSSLGFGLGGESERLESMVSRVSDGVDSHTEVLSLLWREAAAKAINAERQLAESMAEVERLRGLLSQENKCE